MNNGMHGARDGANTTKGGGKRKNRDGRRAARWELAHERSLEREGRGDKGQLAKLLAAGHGGCREARRLAKSLAKG